MYIPLSASGEEGRIPAVEPSAEMSIEIFSEGTFRSSLSSIRISPPHP
jgi:hypothetical protein